MEGIPCGAWFSPTLQPRISRRLHPLRCFGGAPDRNENEAPSFLRIGVSGVTELLRLLSSGRGSLEAVTYSEADGILISSVDEVLRILQSDYENAYFVTGQFTSAIYAEDCIFQDPTISFRGKDLYSRNLKLLVPFFDCPSITLGKIEKGKNSRTSFIFTTWKLRTNLKLPWRPLISIDGNTVYDLDHDYKIVRHAESWNISALEAVWQIFVPGMRSEVK